MEEAIDLKDVLGRVKCVWHNDPSKVQYFTKDAVPMVAPKWIPAEDQSIPDSVKKTPITVAQPAASDQSARILELRKMYVNLGGEDSGYNSWNRGRLEIEVVKLQNAKKEKEPEGETVVSETKVEASETQAEQPEDGKKKKRKYTKKVAEQPAA